MPKIKDKMIQSVSAGKVIESELKQFITIGTKDIVEKLSVENGNLLYDGNKLQFESQAIARQVLEVEYGTELKDIPVGHMIGIFGHEAPNHYLICDGKVYSIKLYPELANHFERQFGANNYYGGDGVNTFAVPTIKEEGDLMFCIKHSTTYFTTENMDSPYASDEEFEAAMNEIMGGTHE